jgi:hypothetical protein
MKHILFTSLITFANLVFAQNQGAQQPHHGAMPPKESMQACEGKKSGVACSFTGRQGEKIEGTCFAPDSEKPLGCKPTKMPSDKNGN